MNKHLSLRRLTIALLALAVPTASINAQNYTWGNVVGGIGQDGDYADEANWLDDGSPATSPPGATSLVVFNTGTSFEDRYTVTMNGSHQVNALTLSGDSVIFSQSNPVGLFEIIVEAPDNHMLLLGNTASTTTYFEITSGLYDFRGGTIGGANNTNTQMVIQGEGTEVDFSIATNRDFNIATGNNAIASLLITDGAVVRHNRITAIGNASNAGDNGSGTLTVLGAGSEYHHTNGANRPFQVGRRGGGAGNYLEVLDGGLVVHQGGSSTANFAIGDQSDGIGHVIVSGTELVEVAPDEFELVRSRLVSGGMFSVGSNGTGTLTISQGGEVFVGENTTRVSRVAAVAGSSGTVTIEDAGSMWLNYQSLFIGGGESEAGGTGIVRVRNDGLLVVSEKELANTKLHVYSIGTLDIDNGLVIAKSDGVVTEAGSALRGRGIIEGNGEIGGTLALGTFTGNTFNDNESGTIDWFGDLTLTEDAELYLSLSSAVSRDQLLVDGDFTIDGSDIFLHFDFLPTFNSTHTLASWSGTGNISIGSVTITGEDVEGFLDVDGNELVFTAIPEPAHALALFGLALVGAYVWRRRSPRS